MIDWDKPIETVDGREARFIGPEPLASLPEARIVHVKNRKHAPLACGDVFLVNNQGYRCDDRASDSEREEPFIRNVRIKRVAWCLVSPKYCIINRNEYYRTEELAREAAFPHERIAKMEWEE